jgi:uncharacterized protein YdaU (DUF1376 family)
MAIQKPSWFKIDAAQFLADTQVDAMSAPELGACTRLLCRQWIDGFIPDDLRLLARLCRLDDAAMGEAWLTLCHFFPVVETGKRANRFMWIEREKVVTELERRSDEGTRAARKRWDSVRLTRDATPNGSGMPVPMQEQSRTEQSRTEESSLSELKGSSDPMKVPSPKKTPHQPTKDACRLAALLKAEILRNKADYKFTRTQERNWAVIADLMLRRDNRTYEKIAKVIQWAQRDGFWMGNVLSMAAVRKQFEQLEFKSSHNGRGKNGAAPKPLDYALTQDESARRAGLEATRARN